MVAILSGRVEGDEAAAVGLLLERLGGLPLHLAGQPGGVAGSFQPTPACWSEVRRGKVWTYRVRARGAYPS